MPSDPSIIRRRPEGRCRGFSHGAAVLILLAATLTIFADVLFTARSLVLSAEGQDAQRQYFHSRAFGFGQLRQGHLPLWNPHTFGGTPCLGDPETALLYPPHVLYLFLPVHRAINWSIALHVLLMGLFTYCWAAGRGLAPLAGVVSATLMMFGGAYISHVYPGHLSNLCTMPWTPLIFLSIDKLSERPRAGWCLLGMLAAAMQILAGHIQYAYFTALAAAVYVGLHVVSRGRAHLARRLDRGRKKRLSATDHKTAGAGATPVTAGKLLAAVALIYAGGAAMSAVQWLTSYEATGESLRAGGMSYAFASAYSLTPESLLTCIAPWFFGGDGTNPYWGRWDWWEMCLFIGTTGLVLAVYGAVRGLRTKRRFCVTMVVVFTVLAVGSYTPLFGILYSWLPGFDRFRGPSKFLFFASLFASMLAGAGLDHLVRAKRLGSALPFGILSAAGLVAITASTIPAGAAVRGSFWRNQVERIASTNGTAVDPPLIAGTARGAQHSLFVAAAAMGAAGMLVAGTRRWPGLVYAVAALAIAEVGLFARTCLATFDVESTRCPQIEAFLEGRPKEHRIQNITAPESASSNGSLDVWGERLLQVPRRRYVEFMAFTQDLAPDLVTDYGFAVVKPDPLLALTRCRFQLLVNNGELLARELEDPMPRLKLVRRFVLRDSRDEVLRELRSPGFDLNSMVVLEDEPVAPSGSSDLAESASTLSVEDESTDHLTIRAELAKPSILLLTDAYSRGWRATPLPGSRQHTYQVLPADYAFMAVPMSAGRHHLTLEYRPWGYEVGKWISLASVLTYLCAGAWCLRRSRLRRNGEAK